MTKHFLVVVVMSMFAALAIRLWIENYPVSAKSAGIL